MCTYKNVTMEEIQSYAYSKPSNTLALACSTNPEILYVPHQEAIRVYNTRTGKCLNTYRMHLGNVLGLVHNTRHNVLYSFGKDKLFLVWVPKAYNFNTNFEELIQSDWDHI